MVPLSELSSTRYWLTDAGSEYLVYLPESTIARIDLRNTNGEYEVDWFIPLMNLTLKRPRTIIGVILCKNTAAPSMDAAFYLNRKAATD
jgi:hypothetical protein